MEDIFITLLIVLVEHREVISDPVSFVYRGYQLRLKERK